MSLIELQIPPGVFRNGTKRDARGRFYDANLIRWKSGKLKPIGGGAKTTASALTGCRIRQASRSQWAARSRMVTSHSTHWSLIRTRRYPLSFGEGRLITFRSFARTGSTSYMPSAMYPMLARARPITPFE